jgi:hypothetical protein
MTQLPFSYNYLLNEAHSLLTRLQQVKPFSMTMPMVRGASISGDAFKAVSDLLENGKKEIYESVMKFIASVNNSAKTGEDLNTIQSSFTILKLRYNSILDQLDIFADVLSQRSEHEVGVWLSGLDVLAEDGLQAGKELFEIPALMVFLERGHGAAIRRARTRLPGGDENPVAIIQIPRERMVGSGIAASLIHEVGHQAAESLQLTTRIKTALGKITGSTTKNTDAWKHYERWISEILADLWAMGHLGISATLGLMGVVMLPKYFQFRLDLDDPHPAPYIRVKLSCAFGKALFPHPQWDRLWQTWQHFYPHTGLPEDKQTLLQQLNEEEHAFVQLLLNFKTVTLNGRAVKDLFPAQERQPRQLQQLFKAWQQNNELIKTAAPSLVFAVLGQAKHDFVLSAEEENRLLTLQLRQWAYNRN